MFSASPTGATLQAKRHVLRWLSGTLGLPLSLIARVVARDQNLSIFGSWKGKIIGDNSWSLYLHHLARKKKVFFLTKSLSEIRRVRETGDHSAVWAFSPRGIALQLSAGTIYYSHSIADFVAPLTVGANIVCLQHGYPAKHGGASNPRNDEFKRFGGRWGRLFAPFAYYYYCHEVWSPRGIFVENTEKIFSVTKPRIIVSRPPRLWDFRPWTHPGTILLAPTHFQYEGLRGRLSRWGIPGPDSATFEILRREQLRLVLRPHPLDAEEAAGLSLPTYVDVDKSPSSVGSLEDCRLLITDASSLAFDAAELGISYFFLSDELERFIATEVGLFESVRSHMMNSAVTSVGEAIERLWHN